MFSIENYSGFAVENGVAWSPYMDESLLDRRRREHPGQADLVHVRALAAAAIADLDLSPPIDPAIVASHYGIRRIDLVEMAWAGCLVSHGGEVTMKVRASDPPQRRRFTSFHEVAHTFIPGYFLAPQFRCDPRPGVARDNLEGLCDAAASEFLLPADHMLGDLVAGDFGFELVEDLADYYQASLEATAHRLVALWPEDVALAIFEPRNKLRDEHGAAVKLRLNTFHGSGSWPYVPKHVSIDGDPVEDVLGGEVVECTSDLHLGACALGRIQTIAKLYPFNDQEGKVHNRVLILFRRSPANRSLERRG